MPRPDISEYLIHFTSGATDDEAYSRLCNIVDERCLKGSGNKIKGQFNCVCFSEAPIQALSAGLVNDQGLLRYSLFGIIFNKKWIFGKGGRPVIYQTDDEFNLLSSGIAWRHVRYEPDAVSPVDFTWEREWRINTNRLEFNPSVTGIIFPNLNWASRFQREFDDVQDLVVQEYAQMLDDQLLAEGYRENMPWQVYPLRGG